MPATVSGNLSLLIARAVIDNTAAISPGLPGEFSAFEDK